MCPTDNPFSEAQFKTLKYRPDFPEQIRFDPGRQGVLPGLLPLVQQRPLPFRSELANPSDGPFRSDRSGSGTTPACSGSRSSATSRTFRQCTEKDRWAAGQGVDQPARRVAYGSLNSECRCLTLVDTFRPEHLCIRTDVVVVGPWCAFTLQSRYKTFKWPIQCNRSAQSINVRKNSP